MDKAGIKTNAMLEETVKKNIGIFQTIFHKDEARIVGILRDGYGVP